MSSCNISIIVKYICLDSCGIITIGGIKGSFLRCMDESLAELKLMSHYRGWRVESESFSRRVLSCSGIVWHLHITVLLLKLGLVLWWKWAAWYISHEPLLCVSALYSQTLHGAIFHCFVRESTLTINNYVRTQAENMSQLFVRWLFAFDNWISYTVL